MECCFILAFIIYFFLKNWAYESTDQSSLSRLKRSQFGGIRYTLFSDKPILLFGIINGWNREIGIFDFVCVIICLTKRHLF